MLTIQSGINQNTYLNPAFTSGKRVKKQERELTPEEIEAREARKAEQEYNKERDTWEAQKETFENLATNAEAKLPKSFKTAAKGGALLAAGMLAGMASCWSAKYIIEAFQKMGKTKAVQALAKKLKTDVAEPLKNIYKSSRKYISNQFNKMKKSDTYVSYKDKYTEFAAKYKNSKFNNNVQKVLNTIKENKVVKGVAGFLNNIFDKFADGVMYLYNKIASAGVKNTVANVTGVAGGASTIGVSVMENIKKPETENNDVDAPNYDDGSIEDDETGEV